jgi:uroporphyrinogen-III synthase
VSTLDGIRIVVTRASSKADPLCEKLEALGAVVIHMPAIHISGVSGDDASDALLRAVATYDWAVFTSANGVRHGLARMRQLATGPEAFRDLRVAAVGPATATALREAGIDVAAMPAVHVGEHIADVVEPIDGRRFLLVRGDIASPALPARLRAAGGHVDEVVAYTTTMPESMRTGVHGLRDVHAITFTSPSTVRGFMASIGDDRSGLEHAAIVTIGPVTSDEARSAGLAVAAEARPHTIDGLVTALVAYFAGDARVPR